MRTAVRLKALQKWTYKTVCEGRKMKTPAPNMDYTKIVRQEPKVFLGYAPTRPDTSEYSGDVDPLNVAPGIIIAPVNGEVHFLEEKRFDRYSGVHRPQEMGQSLTVQNVFMVYEDGIRLPGFRLSRLLGISFRNAGRSRRSFFGIFINDFLHSLQAFHNSVQCFCFTQSAADQVIIVFLAVVQQFFIQRTGFVIHRCILEQKVNHP